MSVCFTNENIHVQFIDDNAGVTLAAEAALAKGIKAVVFDRGAARFHQSENKGKDGKPVPVIGKLATLAQAARAAGLKF